MIHTDDAILDAIIFPKLSLVIISADTHNKTPNNTIKQGYQHILNKSKLKFESQGLSN